MSLSVVIWKDQKRWGTFTQAEPSLTIGFWRVLRLIRVRNRYSFTWWDFLIVRSAQNKTGKIHAPFHFRTTCLSYISTLSGSRKGENELLSHILWPAGRAELPAYLGARFVGSLVGSYLRAARSLVSLQQLVRILFFFFFLQGTLHIFYFPHLSKRTQTGGPFHEAVSPLPTLGK